jgi:hypothetical protein
VTVLLGCGADGDQQPVEILPTRTARPKVRRDAGVALLRRGITGHELDVNGSSTMASSQPRSLASHCKKRQGCPARCWAPRGVIQIPVSRQRGPQLTSGVEHRLVDRIAIRSEFDHQSSSGTPPRTSATTTRRCLMRQITELGSGDLQLQPTAASAHRAILTSSS